MFARVFHRCRGMIGVEQFSAFRVTVNLHILRKRRIQTENAVFHRHGQSVHTHCPTKANGTSSPPRMKMNSFPVWRYAGREFYTADGQRLIPYPRTLTSIAIQMQRQACNRIGKQSHTGIYSHNLHRRSLIDLTLRCVMPNTNKLPESRTLSWNIRQSLQCISRLAENIEPA